MLAVSSSNHRQRSGRNLVNGHAIPGSGLQTVTNDLANSYTGLPEAREAAQDRGFTDSCSRAVIRRTFVRGQLFARPFFAGNVVRGVNCSPDSYAHGQLAAHQSTVNCWACP